MFVTFGTLRVKALFTQHWCEFCTDVAWKFENSVWRVCERTRLANWHISLKQISNRTYIHCVNRSNLPVDPFLTEMVGKTAFARNWFKTQTNNVKRDFKMKEVPGIKPSEISDKLLDSACNLRHVYKWIKGRIWSEDACSLIPHTPSLLLSGSVVAQWLHPKFFLVVSYRVPVSQYNYVSQ